MTFFVSLGYIGGLCWLVVDRVSVVGCGLGIHPIIMGITVLAMGNCMPDLLSSVAASRQGLGPMAIASAFGTVMFNFCFALGLPMAIDTCLVRPGAHVPLDVERMAGPVGLMMGSIVCVGVSLCVSGWRLTAAVGVALVTLYVGYVIFIFATFKH